MISDNPPFEAFIQQHRWAVLTTLRDGSDRDASPVSSVVAYAIDDDSLIVSTPGMTFKRRSIERREKVNLCAMSNSEPFNFVAIEGVAQVQQPELARLMQLTRKVFENIKDTNFTEPDDFAGWLQSQDRVILRITPTRIYGVIR